MAAYKPWLISGVMANTGKMNDWYISWGKDDLAKCYPAPKFVVFLASPTDFRYQEMHHDRDFLERLGWRTEWMEFKGGHTFAPPELYDLAAQWVAQQWKKD